MRKLILASLMAAAVTVPVAFAAPGGNGNKPSKPEPTVKAAPKVAFVVKGVVTAVAGTDITITVNGGNTHAKKALKGVTTFTVKTDASTKFSKAGVTGATIANIVANDRVVVRYAAKKKSTAGELGALFAKKVTDQGPKPAA